MKYLNRRTFLISSLAGASTLIFADKAFTTQKEAIDLLNPAMGEQLFIFLKVKWGNMSVPHWHKL